MRWFWCFISVMTMFQRFPVGSNVLQMWKIYASRSAFYRFWLHNVANHQKLGQSLGLSCQFLSLCQVSFSYFHRPVRHIISWVLINIATQTANINTATATCRTKDCDKFNIRLETRSVYHTKHELMTGAGGEIWTHVPLRDGILSPAHKAPIPIDWPGSATPAQPPIIFPQVSFHASRGIRWPRVSIKEWHKK